MIARRKRLLAVRTRQHERAHAALQTAELARAAAESAHHVACDAMERLLVESWELGALERATAAIEGQRLRAVECTETVVSAAEGQRSAAFARRRAERALETARAHARADALRREQIEHDERASRRR